MVARLLPILITILVFAVVTATLVRWIMRPREFADDIGYAVTRVGGTDSVVILAGVAMYLLTSIIVCVGVIVAIRAGTQGVVVSPAPFWERVVDGSWIAAGAFAGIGGGIKLGKRKTTDPLVIAAQADAAVKLSKAQDEQPPGHDDPRLRGTDDEGQPL